MKNILTSLTILAALGSHAMAALAAPAAGTLCGAALLVASLLAPGGRLAAADGTASREGLLLEYRFEGDGMADTSGNGRDGVPKGQVLPTPGKDGQGMLFDGNGSHVETPLRTGDLPDTFTVEFWVKPDASQNLYADIFGNHSGDPASNTAGGFALQQDGAKTNRYAFGYGAGGQWVSTTPVALAAEEWQHVSIVKSKETLSIYLNGEVVDSVPASDPMAASPIPLLIGLGFSDTARTFQGCIDEFRVWNRAIPPK